MLDLSAIWCPPCRTEADYLETVYQQYRDRGVRFLTVLMDEDNQLVDFGGRPVPAECRNWGDRSATFLDHTFPCWVDPNDGAKDAWPKYNKFGALPTNVIGAITRPCSRNWKGRWPRPRQGCISPTR